MKRVLYSALFFVCFTSSAEPDMSYVVLSASSIGSEKQPTWICLEHRSRCVHIASDNKPAALKPGTYYLSHIDFHKSKHVSHGAQFFKTHTKFKFEPGLIYFVGDLQMSKKGRSRNYDTDLSQDSSILIEACASSPDIFEKYPVTDLTGSKRLNFSCSTSSN